ncbi:hypothetical protein F4803DRAFT_526882 [Xylaria telfairii]|nr:hypothetical protein F4803DRAFT_526882 [Xylaria telfairii]
MKHLSVILALSVAYVRAQELNQIIVGCVELDCPPSSADKVDDDCTVADNSFSYVGLTSLPTQNTDLKGKVTWTKGFNITDTPDNNRTFNSAFYLGTSPDLDLSNTGACAVLFHGIETSLSFDLVDGDRDTAQGTCSDAMGGKTCVAALVDRAKRVLGTFGNDTPSSEEACAKLQDDLYNNMDAACLYTSKGSWTNLTSAVLSGKGAPEPLSGDKNASSTCWPVLPKENQLTLVSEYQKNGSRQADEAQAAMHAVTPILTLFFPTGNQSIVTEADASLSCLKVVGPSKASVDTMMDGSQDSDSDPDSGASKRFSSHSVFFGVIVATVAAAWLA